AAHPLRRPVNGPHASNVCPGRAGRFISRQRLTCLTTPCDDLASSTSSTRGDQPVVCSDRFLAAATVICVPLTAFARPLKRNLRNHSLPLIEKGREAAHRCRQ